MKTSPAQPRRQISLPIKLAISFGVLWHLWAVVAEPVRFSSRGPGGPSPAASALHRPVRAYSEFAYLSHGYAFFAPDPGPSHLIRASWTDSAGKSQSQTFPDRHDQWPRLMYHRHFMLTEFLNTLFEPSQIAPEIPRESQAFRQWREDRDRFELVRNSFANHLAKAHHVDRVVIERIEHRMPGIPEVLVEAIGLQDERLYSVMPDGPPLDAPPLTGPPLARPPFTRPEPIESTPVPAVSADESAAP